MGVKNFALELSVVWKIFGGRCTSVLNTVLHFARPIPSVCLSVTSRSTAKTKRDRPI